MAAARERGLGLWDNCYRPLEREIAREEGEIDEVLRGEKLLWPSIGQHYRDGQRRSEPNGLSRGSDLFSPKFLDPATHSFSRLLSEIQNDVGILIEIKNSKIFLGIDDNGILP